MFDQNFRQKDWRCLQSLSQAHVFAKDHVPGNLKAAASAADPSSSLARNMLSPRLHGLLAGWQDGS